MAIRAGELGIPAVIGAGEALFQRWRLRARLCLDCANQQVSAHRVKARRRHPAGRGRSRLRRATRLPRSGVDKLPDGLRAARPCRAQCHRGGSGVVRRSRRRRPRPDRRQRSCGVGRRCARTRHARERSARFGGAARPARSGRMPRHASDSAALRDPVTPRRRARHAASDHRVNGEPKEVNSFHRFRRFRVEATARLSGRLRTTASSRQFATTQPMTGIMWHPERFAPFVCRRRGAVPSNLRGQRDARSHPGRRSRQPHGASRRRAPEMSCRARWPDADRAANRGTAARRVDEIGVVRGYRAEMIDLPGLHYFAMRAGPKPTW